MDNHQLHNPSVYLHINILDTPAEQPRIFYYYEQQLLIVYIYTISQVIGELALMWTPCSHVMEVALFPGSPHAQTKSQKKGESLVKFIMWEMPWVERDTLIRCGRVNEHFIDRIKQMHL